MGKKTATPSVNNLKKWRPWHEREIPIKIHGEKTAEGVVINISSTPLSANLELKYPNSIWKKYPNENKSKLIDNITYVFTSHLPFLLKGNIRLDYNTAYPQSYSWSNQCFIRHLPAYWYLYNRKRGTRVLPMLKTLLNSRANFGETKDIPPRFPESIDENVIIPFSFGKDSFLTYRIAKEIGLKPVLIWFNDTLEGDYEGKHKRKLYKQFSKLVDDPMYFITIPLGSLREPGEGWFGWEMALTSYAILTLPFAYYFKSGYLLLSNEKSANYFFYDEEGRRITPDYEQSAQATEEISLLMQALSEGEVYTSTFLQGLEEIAIISILKNRYYKDTFKYLMSCWAEVEEAKNKRWCGNCSKCARIYAYLAAMGINPKNEAGFKDNMFEASKVMLFNVFEHKASGTGWDAFGLNRDEQSLAFYICYLRGVREPLIVKFSKTPLFKEVRRNYKAMVEEFFSLHEESTTPPQWKARLAKILKTSLNEVRRELLSLDV